MCRAAASLLPFLLIQPLAPAQSSEEALRYLQAYLRIDTSNPPGDTLKAARFLQDILESAGIATRLYESVPGKKANLLARLPAGRPSGKKPLLLLHHMDVVPADPERWPVDPFSGAIREGQLWGRGAMDMKAHGIVHLMTLLELKRNRVPLSRDILLLAVADEEVGGGMGAAWMIRHHFSDLDPEYLIDEGGFGFRRLLSEQRIVFGISVAEKEVLWLKLTARGTAGHGSQPLEENANTILLQALGRIFSRPEPVKEHPILREMQRRTGGPLPSNRFTRALGQNTISLTTLRAGVGEPPKINVIPSVSTATLDCRLLPGESREAFLEELRTLVADDRVAFEVVYGSQAKQTSSYQTPLFRAMETTLKRHYPEAVVTPLIIPYGTDSTGFRLQGVQAYGLLPVVVEPENLASLHSDSERIPLQEFGRGLSLFYRMMVEFLRHDGAP